MQRAGRSRGNKPADKDHPIAHHAHGDRPVDIGKRRGQRHRESRRRHGLQAQQLKKRARKYVHARCKDICPEKFVAVRAAVFGKTVEQPHKLLEQQLDLPRHGRELRDHKDPAHQRKYDQ